MHPAEKIPYRLPKVPYIVSGRKEHIDALNGKLREVDFQEALAATGNDPYKELRESWKNSTHRWSVIYCGDIIAVGGLVPLSSLGPIGLPWLVGSDGLDLIKLTLVRDSRRYIDFMLSIYPVLMNVVDVRNKPSIKFLKGVGFKLEDKPIPLGPKKMPFYRFKMERGQ